VDATLDQLGCECRQHCCISLGSPGFDDKILSCGPSERAEALKKCPFKLFGIGPTSGPEQPDASG
jgi:hypothetical protein